MAELRRVGLIVPSSNTTIETEIPRMLRRTPLGTEFTFHSSRAVLQEVDAGSLDRMVADSDRCARELGDAPLDVVVYACLVAVMARGHGAHEQIEGRLREVLEQKGSRAPVTSSAGALVRTLQGLRAQRVAIITPYVPALTDLVRQYLQGYGVEVVDSVSLSVADNVEVGRLDPMDLCSHAERLRMAGADVLIASACVQMPSLEAVEALEDRFGVPIVTAATATTAEILDTLGLARRVPHAGSLLWAAGDEPGGADPTGALGRRPPVQPASTARLPPVY